MLLLPIVSPDEEVLNELTEWQRRVDAEMDYPQRVAAAQKYWPAYRSHSTMSTVQRLLTEMCSGGRRCAYCEDSMGTDIEHIWPKSLYPERAFDWMNYLLACGRCNQHKGVHWAVFPSSSGPYQVVSRPPNAPPTTPPPSGDPVFVNPRQEDALQILMLDLRRFRFVVYPRLSGRERDRADYTLRILLLNDESLCQERADQYGNYLARLKEYLHDKQQGVSSARLARRRTGLLRMRLPTVFREMQRQQANFAELRALFGQIPEALSW